MFRHKNTRIAILMVILLSGVSFWIINNTNKGTLRKELYDFAIDDTGSVTRIYMVNTGGKQLTLDKQRPGSWQVNGKFTARNDAVNNLLVCMKDLEVRQPVAKAALENVSKQLASSSTKVEIYQNEKLVKVYYVGGDTQDGLGTFMLLSDPETGENSIMPFVMFIPGFNGFLSVRYFMEEDLWRDRTVFGFLPDDIASIKVDYTHLPDSGFTLSLSEKYDITLADSRGKNIPVFDTLKAKRYITYYTNIQYEAIQNDRRKTYKDSVLARGAVHMITLKDREGKEHVITTYSKPHDDPNKVDDVTGKPVLDDPERMFALINEGKDLVLIQYYVFGKLFMGVSWFNPPRAVPAAPVKK